MKKDITYPRGYKTVVEEKILLPNYDINYAYNKLYSGFQERNKYKQGLITEIRDTNKPNFMKIYSYNDVPMVSARGNEKDIIINLTQKEKDVEIEIKIDSYIARRKNKRIITEADLHWPEIVEEISIDLLGYEEPDLRNRLFPEKHKQIMRFDRNLLIVIGLIFLGYAFIDFSSILNFAVMMGLILGGTYLYNYFKK